MTFVAYLVGMVLCFAGAVLVPNQGQAFGLALVAVLLATAAAVQGDILK
ncbi:hypothetical protein [Ferribacterium limneticum]|nr:hypothetical protein [Ferribacterium limneticum]UCV26771.1 hypothetical protein KI617_10660 [Ferribacterium limneticum]UCV30688.1 hypothetical protein KI608_10660 [Ferribacterium limneticum]